MRLKKLVIENFKGCKHREIDFSDETKISGANATGKTTIFDAFNWLLFNKDSHDNEKFAIRPLDTDGNMIDNVEIMVSAVIDIDGKTHELKKTQRQNWVKKRGSQEAKLQGNVNTCEIDGYPRKDAEYKAFIADIIDEDAFKMITSPAYFTSLPWKEQRATLMRFVSDVSDLELAKGNKEFEPIIGELEKAPSTDDIQSKYSRQKKDLTARLKELPVRIDEVNKQRIAVDFAEIELYKGVLNEKIAELETKIAEARDNSEQVKAEAEYKVAVSERQAYEKDFANRYELDKNRYNAELREAEYHAEMAQHNHDGIQDRITEIECRINELKESKKELAKDFTVTKNRMFKHIEFDSNSEICPVCKRRLPDNEVVKLHDEFAKEQVAKEQAFDKEKENDLKAIESKGFEVKDRIEEKQALLKNTKAELKKAEKVLAKANEALEEVKANKPVEPDITNDAEYQRLVEVEQATRTHIDDLKASAVDVTPLIRELDNYKVELEACDKKLAMSAHNEEIDERVAELQTEQRAVSQKIADCEKVLYALEQFIRFKMDRVSNEINSHFNGIKWVLFEVQINGGIKEACQCSYNGVKYSDLNSGHRIVAGLEIIKAMQTLYNAQAPIWVDNAESINNFNIPAMDNQMVLLSVSEDRELVIE